MNTPCQCAALTLAPGVLNIWEDGRLHGLLACLDTDDLASIGMPEVAR